MARNVFLLGGNGFIGRATIRYARDAGLRVTALVRRAEVVADLSALGATCIVANIDDTAAWKPAAASADAVLDLLQPPLPARLTRPAMQRISQQRQYFTSLILSTLQEISPSTRPLLINVSGVDDLQPDARNRVDGASPLRDKPVGFAHIGIPVRHKIERAALPAAHLCLGTVYGPGKGFAETIFPRLARGHFPIIGNGTNRMPLIHVDDVARALCLFVQHDALWLKQPSIVISDSTPTTVNDFFSHAADLLGAPRPRHLPRWLGRLVAGRPLVETLTRDIEVCDTLLRDNGFVLRYSSFHSGLRQTLADLGYPDVSNVEKSIAGAQQ